MEKGNTGNYLKYAIGEILLVVIGILIALQINNWNQNRQDRLEEKVILSNLKEDFRNAIEEFETLNLIRNDLISAAKEVFKLSPESVEEYPITYLDSLISKTLSGPTFNNQSGSLNVLLTSGKINLIRNVELKDILIEWPGYVADMIEDEISQNELLLGRYSVILEQYISWNDLVKAFSFDRARFDAVTLESMPENQTVKSDYSALLNNMTFLNILNRRATFCMISNKETEILIGKAGDIIEMIDNELN
ncbi:MAG: hypothetical protein KJO25_02020 [Bacteroidia bacterium]|nr:hypothetical protein [Bacteroidia bacterium]